MPSLKIQEEIADGCHKLCSERLLSVRYFNMNLNISHQIILYPNYLCSALTINIIDPLMHCFLSVDLLFCLTQFKKNILIKVNTQKNQSLEI